MGWSLPTAIGNLHLLWWWALEYAPTGDLTRFEPEQLTDDLDLGGATPEEFIDAMIYAGFIDHIGSGLAESRHGGGVFRIHDWPDYTTKSLRPRFRRAPERWHKVLTDYGRPIPVRRQRKPTISTLPRNTAPHREPQAESDRSQSPDNIPAHTSQSEEVATTEQQMANTRRLKAEIPRTLSLIPGFVEVWWPRLLDMYQRKGTPLDPNKRRELLALLCTRPNSAIKLLKLCVEHSLNCNWEHLDNTA